MVRAGRLAYVMDAMIVRVTIRSAGAAEVGFGDEGGGDAGQIRQRRPLGRFHGPVAEDAALGRRGVLISLGEGDGGRPRCRWLLPACSGLGGSSCGSTAVEC